jgi:AIPR protein
MINVNQPQVLDLIAEYRAPGRWDSAAFLIWYLENYYRLDPQEAIDAVCDKENDKGVDGIWISEDEEAIVVFQSRLKEDPAKKIGDSPLRTFGGTLLQFRNKAALTAMIESAGMAQVASLARRLELLTKIGSGSYVVRGEFLSNLNIDGNGVAYLKSTPNIRFIGKEHLEARHISSSRDLPMHARATFSTRGYTTTEHKVDTKTRALIVPVKATDLVKLDGIADQSIFAFNVRGPLGNTAINKAIVASIKNRKLHQSFPLFHNGITIIASDVEVKKDSLTTKNYYVVNGCQSLTALFENQKQLTADLRILTKFIKLPKDSALGEVVTMFSNNQNGVRSRDFMSNNRVQIRLQHDFQQHYGGEYFLEIKRGEQDDGGIVLTNENAGLYLMAFDLKEPWATHRKYQVFGEKHAELFARPEATAHRIVMCQVMMEAIKDAIVSMTNQPCSKYVLTRYFFMYTIRLMIDHDPINTSLLSNPQKFVKTAKRRGALRKTMRMVADEIVVDLNAELEPLGDDFDYRDKMRDEAWVKDLSRKIYTLREKLVIQKRMKSIKQLWEEHS